LELPQEPAPRLVAKSAPDEGSENENENENEEERERDGERAQLHCAAGHEGERKHERERERERENARSRLNLSLFSAKPKEKYSLANRVASLSSARHNAIATAAGLSLLGFVLWSSNLPASS
jgi:pullulanase/glycogen debranching enzyme